MQQVVQRELQEKLFMSSNDLEEVCSEIKKEKWTFSFSIMYLNKGKHFRRQFLLSYQLIRCIMKSLIATSTYFLLKYNWKKKKKKTWKVFLGHQSLGTQTGTLVSQTAWLCPCDNEKWKLWKERKREWK